MSFMKILYRWFFRKRLRLTLIGDYEKIHEPAIELHTQKLQFPEFRYMDFLQEELSAQDHPLKQTIKHNGKAYTSCVKLQLYLEVILISRIYLFWFHRKKY